MSLTRFTKGETMNGLDIQTATGASIYAYSVRRDISTGHLALSGYVGRQYENAMQNAYDVTNFTGGTKVNCRNCGANSKHSECEYCGTMR